VRRARWGDGEREREYARVAMRPESSQQLSQQQQEGRDMCLGSGACKVCMACSSTSAKSSVSKHKAWYRWPYNEYAWVKT
jgi:hypothetical protein